MSEARPGDGLKAAEMLAKMCGGNEAEQVKHDHVHLQVDSALIAQLRAGYAELSERSAKACLRLPGGAVSAGSARQDVMLSQGEGSGYARAET
ncbi:MAG TPA: hypothetical protein VIT23_16805 [Terrimicrobiaceae bacterium]